MGFLSKIFGSKQKESKEIQIFSPLSGEIVNIEDVPDVVFSEKIVGDGVAINPNGDTIVAPVNGTIGKIFETNHAFSIESETLRAKAKSVLTPVVISNMDEISNLNKKTGEVVAGESVVLTLNK